MVLGLRKQTRPGKENLALPCSSLQKKNPASGKEVQARSGTSFMKGNGSGLGFEPGPAHADL